MILHSRIILSNIKYCVPSDFILTFIRLVDSYYRDACENVLKINYVVKLLNRNNLQMASYAEIKLSPSYY